MRSSRLLFLLISACVFLAGCQGSHSRIGDRALYGNGDVFGGAESNKSKLQGDFRAVDRWTRLVSRGFRINRLGEPTSCEGKGELCDFTGFTDIEIAVAKGLLLTWLEEVGKQARRDPEGVIQIVEELLDNPGGDAETARHANGRIYVREKTMEKDPYDRRIILVHEFFHKFPVATGGVHPRDDQYLETDGSVHDTSAGYRVSVHRAFTLAALFLVDYGVENDGYAAAVTLDNPLVYWRMGDSNALRARDETGNGNHGDVYRLLRERPSALVGDLDSSTECAGTSWVRADVSRYIKETGSYWLEFWAMRPGVDTWIWVGLGDYRVLVGHGQFVGFNYRPQGGVYGVRRSALFDGTWHHYAALIDGADKTRNRLFIDGEAQEMSQVTSLSNQREPVLGNVLTFVCQANSNGTLIRSRVDEIALYAGDALDADRVLDHFKRGAGQL